MMVVCAETGCGHLPSHDANQGQHVSVQAARRHGLSPWVVRVFGTADA
jgi:hypothetical protein